MAGRAHRQHPQQLPAGVSLTGLHYCFTSLPLPITLPSLLTRSIYTPAGRCAISMAFLPPCSSAVNNLRPNISVITAVQPASPLPPGNREASIYTSFVAGLGNIATLVLLLFTARTSS